MQLAYLSHEACLEHSMGTHHPEAPERLRAIRAYLEDSGLAAELSFLSVDAPHDDLWSIVHAPSLVTHLEQSSPVDGLHWLDGDTAMNPHSLEAARFASGAAIRAIDALAAGDCEAAFCAVRPPGHHAERAMPMGFCLVNHIAVAAAYIRSRYNARRLAILDFDVHHGNGTVDIFRDDPNTLVCSSFQHPFYPGRQLHIEADHIVYSPLVAGSGGDSLIAQIDEVWLPALERHQPEWLLFSAGFDAHREDPLAGLNWQTGDFERLTRRLMEGIGGSPKVLSLLEGGYNLSVLGESVAAHLAALRAYSGGDGGRQVG